VNAVIYASGQVVKTTTYDKNNDGVKIIKSNEYELNGSVLVRIVWYNRKYIIRYSYR